MIDDELELDELDNEEEDLEDVLVEEGPEAVAELERNAFLTELVKQRAQILSTPIPTSVPVGRLIEDRVDRAFRSVLDVIDGKTDHPACMLIPYSNGTNEVIQEYLVTQIRGEDDEVRSLDISGGLTDDFFDLINT